MIENGLGRRVQARRFGAAPADWRSLIIVAGEHHVASASFDGIGGANGTPLHSTTDRGQTNDNQLHALRAWANRLDVEVVAEFADEASGARADRAGLRAMLDAAHRREFDVVLIWTLDRLIREGIGAMVGYLERLTAAGIIVRSHQENWLDTASPVTDLLLAVFAWVARQERERIRERVRAGLVRAWAAGRRCGRPRAILDAARVQKLLDQGLSVREVARQTGHSRATIARRFAPAQKPHSRDGDEAAESLHAVG